MAKSEKKRRDLENQSRDPIETQPKSDIYKPEEKSAEFISTGNSGNMVYLNVIKMRMVGKLC